MGSACVGSPGAPGPVLGASKSRPHSPPPGEGKGVRQGWGQAEGGGPMTSLSCTKALLAVFARPPLSGPPFLL